MTSIPSMCSDYVSRETQARLETYVALIEKWTVSINLVSRSQIPEIWQRHIWDSAQLWHGLPMANLHVDLGSGGGFPAIVLACIAKELSPQTRYTLIESDIRKAVFLRTAVRELGLNAQVMDRRHEQAAPLGAQIVTARALASLDTLLSAAHRHLAEGGRAVFPKGQTWEDEVAVARQNWRFNLDARASITDPNAAILTITDLERA